MAFRQSLAAICKCVFRMPVYIQDQTLEICLIDAWQKHDKHLPNGGFVEISHVRKATKKHLKQTKVLGHGVLFGAMKWRGSLS